MAIEAQDCLTGIGKTIFRIRKAFLRPVKVILDEETKMNLLCNQDMRLYINIFHEPMTIFGIPFETDNDVDGFLVIDNMLVKHKYIP